MVGDSARRTHQPLNPMASLVQFDRILILVLVAICCSCRKAEESGAANNDSHRELAASSVGRSYYLKHDFGEVDKDKNITCMIKLKNEDAEPIVLANSRTTCACLSVKSMPKRIEAGETGVFEIALDTTGRQGFRQLKAIFWDAEPKSCIVLLRTTATIRSCWTTPENIDLGNLIASDPKEHDLFVDVAGYPDAQVLSVSTDANWITLKERKVATSPQLQANGIKAIACYEVIFSGNGASTGNLSAKVVVRVRTDREQTLEVPVTGYFSGDVMVTPTILNFGIITKKEIVRSCTLQFNHPVNIARIKVAAEHSSVKVGIAGDENVPNQFVMTARACLSEKMLASKLVQGTIAGIDGEGATIFRVPYVGVINITK